MASYWYNRTTPWFWNLPFFLGRASIETNFHDLYLKFLDKVNLKPLNKEIVQATYENCKVWFLPHALSPLEKSWCSFLVLVLCSGSLGIRTYKVQCRRTFTAEKFRKLAWQDYNWQKSSSEGTGDRSEIFDYRGSFSSIFFLSSLQTHEPWLLSNLLHSNFLMCRLQFLVYALQAYEKGLMIAVIPFTSKVWSMVYLYALTIYIFFWLILCACIRSWNPVRTVLHISHLTLGQWEFLGCLLRFMQCQIWRWISNLRSR